MGNTRIVGGAHDTPARTTREGELLTLAVQEPFGFHHVLHNQAWTVLVEVDLTSSADTPLCHLKSTISGKDAGRNQYVAIRQITLSGNADLHFEVFLDRSYTSGGTPQTPESLLRPSGAVCPVTLYDAKTAPIVLGTDGTEIRSPFVLANDTRELQEHLLLANQAELAIQVAGAAGNKARVWFDLYQVVDTTSE